MTELNDDHITLIISGSLGGFFLSIVSYILRKYCKNSKCNNKFLGEMEIEMNNKNSPRKEQETNLENV